MTRSSVLLSFRNLIEPELRARGFHGRRGHMVRRAGEVTQVIELQQSIYGGRVTANLGLDLEFLKPLVRWIARPALGPHAHDSTRWIRIGLVRPENADRWWSYGTDSEKSPLEAARGLGESILQYGIPWLDVESDRRAFLRYAESRLDRSRSGDRPHGSYLELRLMAAVLAWNGEIAKAQLYAERARLCWAEERVRLVGARSEYRRKHPEVVGRVPPVPDIQAELDLLISTTTGGSSFSEASPSVKPRRLRSGRMRSSPA